MGSGSATFQSRDTTDKTQIAQATDNLAPAKKEIDQFRSSGGKLPSYTNPESLHAIFGTPTITNDATPGAARTNESAQVIKSFLGKLESVAVQGSSGTGASVDNFTGSPIEDIPPGKAFGVGATAGNDCAGQTPAPAYGGIYMPRESGAGSNTYKAGDGTTVTKNWGPSLRDNSTELSYADGSNKIERADGSGSTTTLDKDGNVHEHSWGKTPAQNYDKIKYTNGDFVVEREDHKQYSHIHTANGGYIEHHSGPAPDDNFDQVRTIDIGTGDAKFAGLVGKLYEQTIPAADRRILDASGDFALHPPSKIDWDNIGPSAGVFGPNDSEGIEIATFRKSSDADPANAKGAIYVDGGTTDNAGGYFQPTSNEVVISKMEKVGHTWVKNNEITATVAHEVGHALDHALYDFSQSAEFSSAYQQDLKSMPPCARSSMNYFLPEGRFGSIENAQRETFAQIYANTLGLSPNTPGVEPYFPKTTDVVKKKLAELANADKEHVVGDTE